MKSILLFALIAATLPVAACGGGSSSNTSTTTPTTPTSGSNVQTITVNAGPAGNYANGAFTSVTVCVPNSSNCQTIDGVLIDTGSSGLRILSSVLNVSLTQQKAADGNPVAECLAFVSGYTWGAVQTANIEISGETASSTPIQVIGSSDFPVPQSCQDQGTSSDTLATLGANGILGVGLFAQDCGGYCVQADNPSGTSAPPMYFECPSSGCTAAWEALTQQLQNPVTQFATDNNGVIIQFPAASAPEASLSGQLIFGIGTESNNGLDGATIYPADSNGFISTVYNSQTYTQSFLDSGSNGIFFLSQTETGIPTCSDMDYFYCPGTVDNLSATNEAGGNSGQVSFSIANADTMFNDNPTATVFGQLGGPNTFSGFDWGLPFFYGRSVYTAIQGQNTPSGQGPYWAF
jgi:Protein of unknown function (DUF3443)